MSFLGKMRNTQDWKGPIAAQVAILTLFVEAAEVDLSDAKSDLVYMYQCPRDKVECENKNDLDWRGV